MFLFIPFFYTSLKLINNLVTNFYKKTPKSLTEINKNKSNNTLNEFTLQKRLHDKTAKHL